MSETTSEGPEAGTVHTPMAQATGSSDHDKWEAEKAFRERELQIKERQQRVSEVDLELRQAERASALWKSPLVVAVFAAAIAGLSNAAVSYLNAKAQTNLEAKKAEQARILEMIKTGDADKAAANLQFLLDARLIVEPNLRADLTNYLGRRVQGSGPVLPSSGGTSNLTELVSKFEGVGLKPYKDPAGRLFIGFGHQLADEEVRSGNINIDGVSVPYELGITGDQARRLLQADLEPFQKVVDELVKVPLTPNQKAALVSLTFQIGAASFRRSSLLHKLNAGQYEAVPEELQRWTRADGRVLPGMAARREAEAELWKKP